MELLGFILFCVKRSSWWSLAALSVLPGVLCVLALTALGSRRSGASVRAFSRSQSGQAQGSCCPGRDETQQQGAFCPARLYPSTLESAPGRTGDSRAASVSPGSALPLQCRGCGDEPPSLGMRDGGGQYCFPVSLLCFQQDPAPS